MDTTFPSKAIILNRHNWREADRLVSVYTPEFGKLSLLARGACKLNSKLAAHLEPISLSQILIIKGKGFDYIGSALMLDSFSEIKKDLNKLYFAGRALDFFNRLVKEGEGDASLFYWLEKWLNNLNQSGKNGILDKDDGRFRLAFFYWRFLALLGYSLNFDNCIVCQNKIIAGGSNRLDFWRGGLLCPVCNGKGLDLEQNFKREAIIGISDNCIKLLRYLENKTEANLKSLKLPIKVLKEWERLHEKRALWLDI